MGDTNKSYRTLVLVLLTMVYGFNFIDRQIVGILAPFFSEELGLTNTQLGMLTGILFAAFYTLVGIPIAWLADRYNRVNIISVALATWSGFTALTGFAGSFLHMGLARMGVGIGEAGGSPPSHSIISDLYPKEKAGQRTWRFIRWVFPLALCVPISLRPCCWANRASLSIGGGYLSFWA